MIISLKIRGDTRNGFISSVFYCLMGNIVIYFRWIKKLKEVDRDFIDLDMFDKIKLIL